MLEKCVAKFRAADTNRRGKMVEKAVDSIESKWKGNAEFNRDKVTSVCELSAKLAHSQTFLACFQASVWKCETKTKETNIRKEGMELP